MISTIGTLERARSAGEYENLVDVSDQPEPPETRDNACTVRELEASWMSASRSMEANGNSFHDSPGRGTRKLIELSCCGRNKFLSLQERLSKSIYLNAILLELSLVGVMLVIGVERVVLMKKLFSILSEPGSMVSMKPTRAE